MAENCYSCEQTAAERLPPREQVARTTHWRVAHAFDTALRGWLVALPLRHVTALADLRAAEAAELGPLLHRLSSALRDVVGCTRTYVMLFAEADGFAHLHFHVVPRMPDQPPEIRGPNVFRMLGRPESERIPLGEMDDVAIAVAARLRGAEEAKTQ